MQNKSERERLIEKISQDYSQRIHISKDELDLSNIAEPEQYLILAEHWRYLLRLKKSLTDEQKKDIQEKIYKVQQFMREAEFGDKNVDRFNMI